MFPVQNIVAVYVRHNNLINNLIFGMADGSKSPDCGNDEGKLSTDQAEGCNLAFVMGHAGNVIDAIQFVWIC